MVTRLAAGLLVAANLAARAAGANTPPIRLVVIDHKTQAAFGPLPWPRDRHAEIVRALAAAGARAVALRFYYRDDRGERGDAALVSAVKASGSVFIEIGRADAAEGWQPADDWLAAHELKVEGTPPSRTFGADHVQVPFESLARAARGVGSIDVMVNRERRLEGLPLVARYRGRIFPSLALQLFLFVSGPDGVPLAFEHTVEKRYWILRRREAKAIRIGRTRVAVNPFGCALVNLTAPGRGYRTVSFVDVLKGKVKPAEFRGAVVLVGAEAAGLDVQTATGPKSGLELVADQLAALYQYAEDAGR